MKDENERRISLAKELNGELANLNAAIRRHNAATVSVDEVAEALGKEYNRYACIRHRLLGETSPVIIDLTEEVNTVLGDIAKIEAQYHRTCSERGTARSEVEKCEKRVADLRVQLAKLLPNGKVPLPADLTT